MSRFHWPVAALLAGTSLTAAVLAGCGTGSPLAADKPNVPGATVVVLKGLAFHPAAVTVKAGTAVDWRFEDSVVHNVISPGGGPLRSPLKQSGDWDYAFTTPGTYNYVCSIHQEMTGTVTVTP